jgi:glyoxylase-like metal-dependent hydrolase (beta-lactamase superfamily II)
MFAAAASSAFAQQAEAPVREIVQVEGDLYRFQDNQHFGVFLVTDEGIVVADPLNRGAAEWLAGELDARFDVPVQYVVYTHHHGDHASGAAVWPEATVVAHADAKAALTPPAAGTPEYEAFQEEFGEGSPYGGTRAPDETFAGAQHSINLGGETVTLVHVGGNHASDMSLILFPEQDTLFAADIISGRRLAFMNMPGFDPVDQQAMVDAALAQDFEHFVPGHGDMGGRVDVEAYGQYFRDLLAGVQAGIDAGQSLEEIQQTLLLEDYADWGAYDIWRTGNIEGAHRYLTSES